MTVDYLTEAEAAGVKSAASAGGTTAKRSSRKHGNTNTIARVGLFPPIWARTAKKPSRVLAWAAEGLLTTEHGDTFPYLGPSDLRILVHEAAADGLLLYMPAKDFEALIPDFLSRRECVWSDSAGKIVAFKVRSGRRTRYIYRATVWAQLDGIDKLAELRRFLDDMGVGDLGTPGAVGIRLMYAHYPRGKRQFRPPSAAWQDLYNNLIAGRTELLEPFKGRAAVELDLNNAYAAGIAAGVPQGRCWRVFEEIDAEPAAWWYGHWKWRLPAKIPYGVLGSRPPVTGRRRLRSRLSWPRDGGSEGEGWYTGEEIAEARKAGYICEFQGRGWAWEQLSTDFAEWAQWMDAAKLAYRAQRTEPARATLPEQWIKLATVAAIGRLGMDCMEKTVWAPDDVWNVDAYTPIDSCEVVDVMLSERHCPPSRGDLLIHVCVQVHAYVRAQLRAAHTALLAEGFKACMSNIDCFYVVDVQELPPLVQFGAGLGAWKQKRLTPAEDCGTIRVESAGWVLAGNLTKTPGVPHQ